MCTSQGHHLWPMLYIIQLMYKYCIVGNFWETNFREVRGFVAICEIFPQNLGVCHFFGSTSKQSSKVFSAKILIPPICVSFLSWSTYTIYGQEAVWIPQPPNQTSCHSQGTMVTASQSFTQLHNQWRWFGHLQTHSRVATVYCGISYSFRYATTSQLDSSIYGCRGEEWVLSMSVILSTLNHVGTVNK